MNKILQVPLVRIMIATLFVGVRVAIGQVALNLLRSALSITDAGVANLLAFFWSHLRCILHIGCMSALWKNASQPNSEVRTPFRNSDSVLWVVRLRGGDSVAVGFLPR